MELFRVEFADEWLETFLKFMNPYKRPFGKVMTMNDAMVGLCGCVRQWRRGGGNDDRAHASRIKVVCVLQTVMGRHTLPNIVKRNSLPVY